MSASETVMQHQTEKVENAGLEIVGPICRGGKCRTGNAGNDIVWNAAHCLCLLSWKQALSRFKRARV